MSLPKAPAGKKAKFADAMKAVRYVQEFRAKHPQASHEFMVQRVSSLELLAKDLDGKRDGPIVRGMSISRH